MYSHHDHAGGNAEILKTYPLPIIGGRDCAKVNKTPAHGESFTIGQSIKVKALHTPCHTQDSICFLFEDGDEKAVFTGDTLFIGGKTSRFLCRRISDANIVTQAAVVSLKAQQKKCTRH